MTPGEPLTGDTSFSPSAGGSWGWSSPDVTPPKPSGDRGPTRRQLGLVAVVGLALAAAFLVYTVVGGSKGGALNPIAQAAEQTASYPGERIALNATMSSSSLPETIQMQGHGAFNGQTQTGWINVTAQGPPPLNSLSIREIVQGTTIYMSSPELTGQLAGGKTWMKIDAFSGQSNGTFGQTDPHAQLEMLKAVSDEFVTVGHESIRGVSTTRYRTAIDSSKEADLLRSQGNDQAADLVEKSASLTGTTQVPVDVWIDGQGLVRRLQMSIPIPTASGQTPTMNMTIDFFDFGAAPKVSAPPPSQVFDATNLAKQSLNALGG